MVKEWLRVVFVIMLLCSMFGLGLAVGVNHKWAENIKSCVEYYDYLINETCPAVRFKYNEKTLDFNINRTIG